MSEKKSMYGFDWKVWIQKNWDSIAAIVLTVSTMITNSHPAWSVMVGLSTKLIISLGRYYLNEQSK